LFREPSVHSGFVPGLGLSFGKALRFQFSYVIPNRQPELVVRLLTNF